MKERSEQERFAKKEMTCYMKRMKPILSTIFILSASLLSLSCSSGEMEEMQSKPPEMPTKPTEEPPAPTCTEAKPIAPIKVSLSDFETPIVNEWQYSLPTGTLGVEGVNPTTSNAKSVQTVYLKKPIDLSGWDAESKAIQIVLGHRYSLPSGQFSAGIDRGFWALGKILVYDQEPYLNEAPYLKDIKPVAEWSITGENWPVYKTDIYFMERPAGNKIWIVFQKSLMAINNFNSNRWEIASMKVGVVEPKLPKQDEKCTPKSTPVAPVAVSLEQATFTYSDKVNWSYKSETGTLEFTKPVVDYLITRGSSEGSLPVASVSDFPATVKNIQVKMYHRYNIVPQGDFARDEGGPILFCMPKINMYLFNGFGSINNSEQKLGQISFVGKKDEVSVVSYVIPRPPSNKLAISLSTSLDYFWDISPSCGRNAMSWKISKIEVLPYVE